MAAETDTHQTYTCSDKVLQRIAAMLTEVTKCGGHVFGGFVRDVIIPRMKNPGCEVKCKDIDLWFKNQTDVNAFVTAMGNQITLFGPDGSVAPKGLYPFYRIRYIFMCFEWMPYIDIIISETFPVNDFDVNRLRFIYIDEIPIMSGIAEVDIGKCDHHEIDALLQSIYAKRATMLPEYAQPLPSLPGETDRNYLRLERVFRRYICRGWNVYVPSRPEPINGYFKAELVTDSNSKFVHNRDDYFFKLIIEKLKQLIWPQEIAPAVPISITRLVADLRALDIDVRRREILRLIEELSALGLESI